MPHCYYTYDASLLILTMLTYSDKFFFVFQKELPILLDIYQRMVDGQVVAKQPDVPLEGLPWTDFCVLLHENVEILITDFHKAKEKVSVPRHQLPLLSSVTFVHTAVSLKRTDIHPPTKRF